MDLITIYRCCSFQLNLDILFKIKLNYDSFQFHNILWF